MPIHDWTQVSAGIFHDFHHEWISTIKRALNAGLLPPGYYSLAEQVAGGLGPDVLTLEDLRPIPGPVEPRTKSANGASTITVATCPPKVRFTASTDMFLKKKKRVVVRHTSDHRVVAMIEIVSPGNKSGQQTLRSFVDKAVEMLDRRVHLLIVDLFPPGPRDPQGIHGAIWSEIGQPGDTFRLPSEQPFTLAAYSAGDAKCAYVEPVAVGMVLPDMPLFLEADSYVPVPLEATYQAAWEGVPQYWRDYLTNAMK